MIILVRNVEEEHKQIFVQIKKVIPSFIHGVLSVSGLKPGKSIKENK